jgi:hypothetical protein
MVKTNFNKDTKKIISGETVTLTLSYQTIQFQGRSNAIPAI